MIKNYLILLLLFSINSKLFSQNNYTSYSYIALYDFEDVFLNLPDSLSAPYDYMNGYWDTNNSYLIIDSSQTNIWEIGKPSKANYFIDTSSNYNIAIITDTLNPYPINNESYFDIYIYQTYYTGCMSFDFKIDCDQTEGGYILFSSDMGLTWVNYLDEQAVSNNSYFNNTLVVYDGTGSSTTYPITTLSNGELGFTGHSDSIQHIKVEYIEEQVKISTNDTLMFRFVFYSDSVDTGKEGWLIDNINIYSSFSTMGGIEENNSQFNIYPNPVRKDLTVKSYQPIIGYRIYDISGKIIQSKDSNVVQVITLKNTPPGVYFIEVYNEEKSLGVKRFIVE